MALLGAIRAWNCSAANCGSYWADFVNLELNPKRTDLNVKVVGEFAVEPRDDLLGFQPFRPHVGGRRDEDADRGLVGHPVAALVNST